MPTLSPLVGRLLALLLLGAVIGLFWLAIAQPVLDRMLSYRETIATAEERLPQLRRLAASAPMLQAQLTQIRRDPQARTRLLSGANESLAGADLQKRVAQITSRYGVVIRSTQPLPARDEADFRRISIRIALEGNTEALHKILYALESSATLLFIDNVQIRSRSGGRVVRNRDRVAPTDSVLAVRLDLSGYTEGPQP